MSSYSISPDSHFNNTNSFQVFVSDNPGDKLYVGEDITTFEMVARQIAQPTHTAGLITRTSHPDGRTTQNLYLYNPDFENFYLAELKTEFSNSVYETVQQWVCEQTTGKMLPSNGTHVINGKKLTGVWCQLENSSIPRFTPAVDYKKQGILEQGTWQLVPRFGTQKAYLRNGVRCVNYHDHKNEIKFIGEFAHVPQYKCNPRNTVLVNGWMQHKAIGMTVQGKFEFCTYSNTMRLCEGKRSFNGVTEEGTFKYIQPLKRYALVQGTKTCKGTTVTGQFAYDPETRTMKLCKPNAS